MIEFHHWYTYVIAFLALGFALDFLGQFAPRREVSGATVASTALAILVLLSLFGVIS